MKNSVDEFELHIPSDKNGSYKPHILNILKRLDRTSISQIHRQFRKLTKTKGAFPNENSLLKLLYMVIQNAFKKWTMPI